MFKHKCRIAKNPEHFSKMKVFELPKIMILICEVSEKSRMWFWGRNWLS